MDKKIVIKKYENRRLYDVTHSRYVNLDEIARAVRDGYEIQVLSATTGEDITRLVMTQIITECAKEPDSVFPLDVLREMVVASGKATQESALNYMRTVADMYKNAWQGFSHTASPLEVMQRMVNSAPDPQAGRISSAQKSTSEPHTSKAQKSKDDTELQELKRRVQELEALVSRDSRAAGPPKKRARTRAKS
jgi:polyhydroxyalkanoate synthesis repressor PhaR